MSRQFTLGLKGEMDWLINHKKVAPESYTYAMATVRYNFVPSKARKLRNYYIDEWEELNARASRPMPKRHVPSGRLHFASRPSRRTATCSTSWMTARRAVRLWPKPLSIMCSLPTTALT